VLLQVLQEAECAMMAIENGFFVRETGAKSCNVVIWILFGLMDYM
jgi:hypothetical protein